MTVTGLMGGRIGGADGLSQRHHSDVLRDSGQEAQSTTDDDV